LNARDLIIVPTALDGRGGPVVINLQHVVSVHSAGVVSTLDDEEQLVDKPLLHIKLSNDDVITVAGWSVEDFYQEAFPDVE
jgi:hypothetical protein